MGSSIPAVESLGFESPPSTASRSEDQRRVSSYSSSSSCPAYLRWLSKVPEKQESVVSPHEPQSLIEAALPGPYSSTSTQRIELMHAMRVESMGFKSPPSTASVPKIQEVFPSTPLPAPLSCEGFDDGTPEEGIDGLALRAPVDDRGGSPRLLFFHLPPADRAHPRHGLLHPPF
ncbi:hypothetical protein GW17_00021174 [Ensete ventricosum]|nr:hypothetical protein GW17_00021174 [Ensete ventricosum]RZR92975.1 hypothetical protein BHM03_00021367 [Ensete ventricosum]